MSRPIGIDLGTTYSAVAYVDEHGKPRVLTNDNGGYFVPSVVLFQEGDAVVGEIAKELAPTEPERVVACVKRHIGDPQITFDDGAGRCYTPTEISALVLQEMKRIAENHLGRVEQAVITVPAYFLDAERKATIEAAELAGLEVLKIVNEPVAAALEFGCQGEGASRTILVYDLGGGTFDVTIMRLRAGSDFEELTTEGNHRLGGRDWDQRLCEHVAAAFAAQHGCDPRDDLQADADLYARAERAKIALSGLEAVSIGCHHAGRSATIKVTRECFERLTADLLELTAVEVDRAVAGPGLTFDEIDLALLVGGSSKMPMVKKLLCSKFRAVESSSNPDQCVALGAALEAARIVSSRSAATGLFKPAAAERLRKIQVLDRTPHALGVIAIENEELVNTVVIPKGSAVPGELSREDYITSRDKQTAITVHLVQGEERDAEACTPLASYDFSGIAPRPAGQSRIRITFRHDSNTVVEVTASDVATGRPLQRATRPLVDLRALLEQGAKPAPHRRQAVLLIDTSGSMAGAEMEEAKRACCSFIDETDFTCVEVGLVQFGQHSEASEWHAMSARSEGLKRAIGRLDASGSTPMAEAIDCGAAMLAKAAADVDRYLVLFTDGCPDDRAQTRTQADRAKQSGIRMICIGVSGADTDLLDELASDADSNFFAASGGQLEKTFGNIAQVISGKRI